MNLSGFKHIINIQRSTQSQDATTGAITKTWANLYTNIPCSIEPLSVKDYIQAKSHQTDVSVRIKIRYLPDLDATMRFVGQSAPYLNRIFNPDGVLEDPHSGQKYITFPCSQGVNDG